MHSAQNIDRLVTWFRACLQSDRVLVLDLYTASIATATCNENIPTLGFDKVLIYVPLRQRIQMKEAREFERVHAIKVARIFLEQTQLVFKKPSHRPGHHDRNRFRHQGLAAISGVR